MPSKQIASTGVSSNSQRYKGRFLAYHQDPDTAPEPQDALHHRHYDPHTGTLTSRDSARDDSNLYRYVRNNPINRADLSGLEETRARGWEQTSWIQGTDAGIMAIRFGGFRIRRSRGSKIPPGEYVYRGQFQPFEAGLFIPDDLNLNVGFIQIVRQLARTRSSL